MEYRNTDIESSYREFDLGRTLYNEVLRIRPKKIIEFGCLNGYSTVAMAMALHEIGSGMIVSYDLWDDYKFKHTTSDVASYNINRFGLTDYVTFKKKDFYEWIKTPEEFDLMHLDISNDGYTILTTFTHLREYINNGSSILFEGGSYDRDQVEWMLKYNKIPINSIKTDVNYRIVDNKFPSLSIIEKNI